MNKAWIWLVLVLAVVLAVVRLSIGQQQPETQLLLNCSSELYDHQQGGNSRQYFMLMDVQAQNHNVILNYRYFSTDGQPLGSVKLEGSITRRPAGVAYDISITHKDEQLLQDVKPSHMDYLSYISNLNLTNKASHPMVIEMLDTDEQQHYAVIRSQPGNAIYGCRLQD